ncbi:MAG: hypothetical protein J6S96_09570 [Muribaculaceae bacterium]|nr:hypothetical protein [Muribaculaceae bacterium]
MKSIKIIYLLLVVLMVISAASCNKDNDDSGDVYVYTTSTSSTLVSKFALQANSDVMANLDSVFFTIDPERNLIYNADSLPVGTNVSALKVSMTFNSSVGSAIFHISDASHNITDYEYSSSSSEDIDFRYGVLLSVTSADGLKTKEYTVKVNVHQVEPDSIVWPVSARRDLPASADENYAFGTAVTGSTYWCLLHNNNGFVLSSADSPAGPWTQNEVSWSFEPDVKSLAACDDKLYLLDVNGNLYTADESLSWTAAGVQWATILGGYTDRILGVTAEPYCYDEYPRREEFTPTAVSEDFPIKGTSQLILAESTWAVAPQAVMMGGETVSGSLVSATWAYDGNRWAEVSGVQSVLPALTGATLFSYVTFTTDETTLKTTAEETWMVMGGKMADGSFNKTTYVSKDHGITWVAGGTAFNLPSTITPFFGARAHVFNETLKVAKSPARRVSQAANQWECPYIFLFGGYNSKGKLQNNIWQGVLTRLTFKPLQ